MVNKKEHTVMYHVDDLMSSHIDSEVNGFFLKFLNKMYRTYGEVKATYGKIHEYLGITIDFSDTRKSKKDLVYFIRKMIDKCFKNITGTDPTPADED